jgi:hypothetical protein
VKKLFPPGWLLQGRSNEQIVLGSITSTTQVKHAAFQNTEHFKSPMKSRYKIEQKNADLKNNYRRRKTDSCGVRAMPLQEVMAIFCANLKRIHRLSGERS